MPETFVDKKVVSRPQGTPLVAVLMGSRSDLETMQATSDTLSELGIPHEMRVMSAHRTPDLVMEYVAGAKGRGIRVVIAAAGGAAHLAGVCASKTDLPVLAVPMPGKSLGGLDSLLSMVQMPAGVPVGTLAIGSAGATNAALLAGQILALSDPTLAQRLADRRAAAAKKISDDPLR